MQDQNKHKNLTAAARYVIDMPYSNTWDNDVTQTLARLETFEHNNELDITAHQLLETALLDKIRLNPDMHEDELLAYLTKMGVNITESTKRIGQDGTSGKERPGNDLSANSARPRAARLITALADRGLDLKTDINIAIIPRAADSRIEEPYWIISVKPWNRQMGVCNLSNQRSFVGRGQRDPEKWAEILSDKTRAQDKAYQKNIISPMSLKLASTMKNTLPACSIFVKMACVMHKSPRK